MSDFFTAGPAEEGAEMPIRLPGESETSCVLIVRGADSEIFRRAQNKTLTRNAELAAQSGNVDEGEYEERKEANVTWLLAHCIKEWPFEEELTIESAVEFLKNAPAIRDQINVFAGARKNFTEANLNKPPKK